MNVLLTGLGWSNRWGVNLCPGWLRVGLPFGLRVRVSGSMGKMPLAGLFGLAGDFDALWASARDDRSKDAAKTATLSSMAIRFIRSSSFRAA
jgi:hypothetical protein